MAFKIPTKTALTAIMAAGFLASASASAIAADVTTNSTSPGNSSPGPVTYGHATTGLNDNSANAPRSATGVAPSSSAAASGKPVHRDRHHAAADHRGMSGSSATDRSSAAGMGTTGGTTGSEMNNAEPGSMMSNTSVREGKMRTHRHHAHRDGMRSHDRTAASERSRDPQGDRAVTALNTLMAAGYESYSGFRADGRNFVATATKDGRTSSVTINPETRSIN